jgi:hypothetical protein
MEFWTRKIILKLLFYTAPKIFTIKQARFESFGRTLCLAAKK